MWANNSSATIGVPYTPSPTYQYNASGASNTITRTAVGTYTIRFPGFGSKGTALVTAYGMPAGHPDDRCKLTNWVTSGVDTLVSVRCFSRTGVLVDSMFTATYTNPDPAAPPPPGLQRSAYLWNDLPSLPIGTTHTPNPVYQFNSTGTPNTVMHLATGTYIVTLPGLGSSGFRESNQVHVTATVGPPRTPPPSATWSRTCPPAGSGDLPG